MIDFTSFFIFILIFINPEQTNAQKQTNFICVDGTEISLNKICDGIVDCPDKSDETKQLCYHLICPKGMFRCHYGACVPTNSLCNGKNDCVDSSDESQCGTAKGSCEKNQFRCNTSRCISVNEICNGKMDCSDGSDESPSICDDFMCPDNSFRCKHGGCVHLDSRCNGINDCVDGSDESKLLCNSLQCSSSKCLAAREKIRCPPINSSRIRVSCKLKSGKYKGVVPCNKPVRAETIASYECKQYFIPVDEKHAKNKASECQLDGSWSRDILKCKPDCGRAELDIVPMVVKGYATRYNLHPWHATLYVLEEGKWTFWCGGSLISEKAVLTAAHCTWKVDLNNMQVAVGKYYSDFRKKEPDTQIRKIARIVMQPLYQDQSGNYGSDLAILVLKESFVLSPTISPICVDWDQEYFHEHLKENNTGSIVGMGVTENETFSDILRATKLPVVSNEKCINDQKKDFRKYITYSTFCAGFKNGTGVCNGDSGGGLVFPFVDDNTRWMIQGIVSISPRRRGTSFCDPQYYTVFTKVAVFVDWIKSVLNSIHVEDYDNMDFTESLSLG